MSTRNPQGAWLDHPALDPLLLGSPLRRPRIARWIIVALVVMVALAVMTFLGAISHMRPDVLDVFVRGVGAASVASIVPVAILRFLDRRERECGWLYAIALLWGAFIATGLALPINMAILSTAADWVAHHPQVQDTLGSEAALLIAAPIAGPLVEEVTKGLGVVALFWLLRAEFDNMRDGFIYGALVGVGFTWVEAPLYVAQNYAQYGVAPWGLQFGARYALFGLGGHALFTGLFGACLGLARQTSKRWVRYIAPVVGLVLAIAAHALNNALALIVVAAGAAAGKAPPDASAPPPDLPLVDVWIGASLMNLLLLLPFVAIMLILLWRSGVWERRVIREELAGEVGRGVSEEEYAGIERDGVFRTRRVDRTNRRRSSALVNAQHELAFRKRRVRDRGGDPDVDPLVTAWRAEIDRLHTARA